jgi:hypothetical protein
MGAGGKKNPVDGDVTNVEFGQTYIWHGLILQIHQYPEDEDRDGP